MGEGLWVRNILPRLRCVGEGVWVRVCGEEVYGCRGVGMECVGICTLYV